MPADHETGDGFRLGLWVSNSRQDAKKRRMNEEQVAGLEALACAWNPHAENFGRELGELPARSTSTNITPDARPAAPGA